jgi:uncharacterized protein YukE
VPQWIRVVSEDLQLSAAKVDVHADELQLRHAAADGAIESAQRGLPAGSSAALSTAVTKWQAATTAVFGRMVEHGTGLRAGAAAYVQADQQGAAAVEAAGEAISPQDMGL